MSTADNIALSKLYLEYVLNDEEMHNKDMLTATNEVLLGNAYPFSFTGVIEDGYGEEELTVEGMPIKDYQAKNITKAILNGTLALNAPTKGPEWERKQVISLVQIIYALVEKGGQLGKPFEVPPQQMGKKEKRFEGDNEGGVE